MEKQHVKSPSCVLTEAQALLSDSFLPINVTWRRFFVVENISCVQRNTSLYNLVFLFSCEGHMLVFTLPAFIRLYLKS